jgi:hypothetical protein
MDDLEFDALLREALAPPERPADARFVRRVDLAVAEAERYRLWRARMLRQLTSEALAVAALAGSLACVAQVPELRAALAQTPELAWPALLLLLLFWLMIRTRPHALA